MKKLNVPGKKGRKLIERDRAVVSQSYTRPYDFVMDHGLGTEVWDVDGNRFLDLCAGIGVCLTGHNHPKVVEAIKHQLDRFIHISSDFFHPIWIEFSERLASTAPFEEPAKVFLANSGTEAVEAAIKLARHHTGRHQFIGFYGGFHGRTLGSLSFTARKPEYRDGFFPMMNGVAHVPYPDPYRPVLSSTHEDYGETVVDFIESVILKNIIPPDDCAAILVEPIQGEGGYIVPPDGFFPALRRLCDRYGILLIVDEIQSGLGRTGKWWAIEHWNTEPDIVCTAKGIASGIPLGGIISRASVMDWPEGAHANTFGGNPIACSAGLATLELIESELMQNTVEIGEYTLDALAEIQVRHPSIGDVRGRGLMIGIDFVEDHDTRKPAHDLRDRIADLAFEYGGLTLGCGDSAIRISPPLNITRPLMDEGLEILETAISEAEAEGFD